MLKLKAIRALNIQLSPISQLRSRLSDISRKKNVCFVTYFEEIGGLNAAFEETHVLWIIGTPELPQETDLAASTDFIWKRQRSTFL